MLQGEGVQSRQWAPSELLHHNMIWVHVCMENDLGSLGWVHKAIDVVPFEHNANEKGAGPVDRDTIVILEGSLEVQDV